MVHKSDGPGERERSNCRRREDWVVTSVVVLVVLAAMVVVVVVVGWPTGDRGLFGIGSQVWWFGSLCTSPVSRPGAK